jgi:hypothetical protein
MRKVTENEEFDGANPILENSAIWKQPFPDYLESPLLSESSKQERSKKHRLFKFFYYLVFFVLAVWMYFRGSLGLSLEILAASSIMVLSSMPFP